MLDKFLSGENVKVNGEIAGRLHILRTQAGLSTLSKVGGYFEKQVENGEQSKAEKVRPGFCGPPRPPEAVGQMV